MNASGAGAPSLRKRLWSTGLARGEGKRLWGLRLPPCAVADRGAPIRANCRTCLSRTLTTITSKKMTI